MPKLSCKDKCKNEVWKHCHIRRYEQGCKQCIVCNICYDPKTSLNQKNIPALRCYCCGNVLRGRPQNKKNYQHHLVYIE